MEPGLKASTEVASRYLALLNVVLILVGFYPCFGLCIAQLTILVNEEI